ncbi:FAD-dependent monooxygenase [Nocardiopsis sp. RSe5-2]|uniref:FAD-dependent monooxygenase n=1 Tax=Nocardiopsis endophytica TaxID=3018445 RepID=A0ABT4U3J9_9ACTN|nr:FAD-dependent monooxygenase [Nocardiopsis endophytica]MDA2811528.1 FAD-dependent monooxygenase [Nocardiopsis endophytica]
MATTVLISGCGVVGPTLAHWLRRKGFAPTVVERAPEPRSGGHRIELSAPALEALRRTGVLDRVRELGAPSPEVEIYPFGGERRYAMEVPLDSAGLAIRRGELCATLLDRARDDAEYVYDDSVTALHQDPGGVDVEFERGPDRRFDLVIGADGLHSNVRGLVFGGTTADHSHYLGTHLVIFSTPNTLGVQDTVMFRRGPYRGCAISAFPGNELLEGLFLFRAERPMDTRAFAPEERDAFVERLFDGLGWRVPWLVEAMRDAKDVHFAPSLQIRMDAWSKGRVALVGDAAFCPDPMTGQGSVLGLVGAIVLAGELAAADGDHARAFAAYEAAMRGFVKSSQGVGGYSTGFVAPRTGRAGMALRDTSMVAMMKAAGLAFRLGARLPAGVESDVDMARYDT